MLITTVTGKVNQEYWGKLEDMYRKQTGSLPEGLVRTLLVQDIADRSTWRIISFWESRQALEKMRSSGETPVAIAIFESVRAKPELSVAEVMQEKNNKPI